MDMGDTQRFWAKVDKTETCWNWTAATSDGYGCYRTRGQTIRAHRYAYEQLVGPIPVGMQIDHRCHQRCCVNPKHLRIATPKQNTENHPVGAVRSTSGVRGVSRDARDGKWRARVQHNGKWVYNKVFQNLKDAEAAVVANRNRFHTHNDADRTA